MTAQTVPSGSVRVRFAPSPTGYLHVGGVRTAIFNWLFARHHGGTFVLRIDDTDVKRHIEEAVQVIVDGLKWAGLDWDEGPEKGGAYGPYYQSQRMDRYRAAAKKLEESGRAVWIKKDRKGELPEWKIEKLKKAGKWDEDLAKAEEDPRPALYFRLHKGDPAPIGFRDAVWGDYSVPPELLPDLVIVRGDGTPTYNFASVVDDVEMKITHIIRGEDHLANTAKQIPIFEALGAPVPVFAHLPMIHNEKGQKISKRRDPVAVTLYQACGLQPEGFFNFLALLGWSPGDNREMLTKEEMISAFSLDRINKSPAQFALKRKGDPPADATDEQRVAWLNESLPGSKIEWMSGEYLKKMPPAEALKAARPFLTAAGCNLDGRDEAWLLGVVKLGQERARTYKQLADAVRLFFVVPTGYDEKAVEKFIRKIDGLDILKAIRDLVATTEWDGEKLKVALEAFATARNLKFGDVAQPIRVALAGAAVSPPIHDTLFLLGRAECLRRLDAALAKLG